MNLINEDQQPSAVNGDEKDKQPGAVNNPEQEKSKKRLGEDTDNPNHVENPDDLHEIQVDDDLNEPDVEALQPAKKDDIGKALPGDLAEGTP